MRTMRAFVRPQAAVVIGSIHLSNTSDGHFKDYRITLRNVSPVGQPERWEVETEWGRIGNAHQRLAKSFPSRRRAEAFINENLVKRIDHGYVFDTRPSLDLIFV
jgi:hypothetical protein